MPKVWGGLEIERSDDWLTVTLHMKSHIVAATQKWLPSLTEKGIVPAGVPEGLKLRKELDQLTLTPADEKVSADRQDVQSIVGILRWMVKILVRITKPVHMLSCVAARPSMGAKSCALGVLAVAYRHRDEGITYGGDTEEPNIVGTLRGTRHSATGHQVDKISALIPTRSAADIVGWSDVTWSRGEDGTDDVMAFTLGHNGAAVTVELKKCGVVLGGSAAGEMLALLKCSDKAMAARIIAARLGKPPDGPTLIISDCDPAVRTMHGEATVARLKHELRRAAIVTERVREGEVKLAHVPDPGMVVDFLTKWVKTDKVEASIAYLTGKAARKPKVPKEDDDTAANIAALISIFEKLTDDE